MKYPVLKVPRCMQDATVKFDTHNKHGYVFIRREKHLTAFIELTFPMPCTREVVDLMDAEIRQFFLNLTNGYTVCRKTPDGSS